jgi:hypothetical protein
MRDMDRCYQSIFFEPPDIGEMPQGAGECGATTDYQGYAGYE